MTLTVHIEQRAKATDVPQDKLYAKYTIDRPGKIVLIGHHLSAKRHQRCLVRTISQFGAELEVSPHMPVPAHFFLEILGINDEMGCTVTRREAEKVIVAFNMLIDPEFLHHVVRLSFELGN